MILMISKRTVITYKFHDSQGSKCSKNAYHSYKYKSHKNNNEFLDNLLKYFKIPSSSKMKISVRSGWIVAPVCGPYLSSCRSRENDSVFSTKSSLVIVTSKHSLRGPAVGDPGLLGNTKEMERNAVN